MFEPIREPLGAFDRLVGPAVRDGASDPTELALDGSPEPSRGATHERIQACDRIVESLRPVGVPTASCGPVLLEVDDLTHAPHATPGV